MGGGEDIYFVHGRRRMAVDIRIPTGLGQSTSGFNRPSAKRREVFGESRGGGASPY